MGDLEKTGRLSFVDLIVKDNGTYYADKLVIDGKTFGPGKSFFPKTMERQTVVDNIWDVLKNPKEVNIQSNGAWRIDGRGRSNIDMVCIINKDGNLTTAYPLIEKIKQ